MGTDQQPRDVGAGIVVSMRAILGAVALALVIGFVVGRAMTGGGVQAAATDAEATATRTAELEELARLQTQVAQPVQCTPAPSPTATATPTPVPPVAMGTVMTQPDGWTLTVNGFSAAAATEGATPNGKFVQVNVSVINNQGMRRAFPFYDWTLTDAVGRTFEVDWNATGQLHGSSWLLDIPPSVEATFAIVFDVAVDTGSTFTLESRSDPSFRVSLQLQLLG